MRIEFDAVLAGRARWAVVKGDSLKALEDLPDNSVDAIVTDPPAGIDFMGKDWDCFRRKNNPADVGRPNVFGRTSRTSPHSYGESKRDAFIAFIDERFRQAFRVLKPGGYSLTWALPRTSHWTATGIENAGFDIRDRIHDFFAPDAAILAFLDSLTDVQRDALLRVIDGQGSASAILHHIFATGFPKNLDIGKALDKKNGVQPIGEKPPSLGMATGPNAAQWNQLNRQLIMPPRQTPDALKWEGWGTALKPAVEHWILGRKPMEKGAKTVIANVLRHGTGGLNIKGCEIPDLVDDEDRKPAHITLQHSPGCADVCVSACPVRALNGQYGADASRFFFQAKASKGEKNAGCELLPIKTPEEMTGRKTGSAGLVMTHEDGRPKANAYAGTSGAPRPNHHPTVKSISLMRWLCRLITPPGGVVLDFFNGSGSTGAGALPEGFRYIGIERDEDGKGNSLGYVNISRARLKHIDPAGAAPNMTIELATVAMSVARHEAGSTLAAMQLAALEGF